VSQKPQLAVFPKAYLEPLCEDGSMTLDEWIELASGLQVDGLEFYAGFLDLRKQADWPKYRQRMADAGLAMPMLCCSPDFTHPSEAFRRQQVDQEKRWIDMTAELGGQFCRVLSGQRRPEVSRSDGLDYVVTCIEQCLPHAESAGVTLVIENHYKDGYWTYPEFAQSMDTFCELVGRIDSPQFAINFDPSNTLLAGEDPLELLRRIVHRVATMHASDRYLAVGTLEELRREENVTGYAERLHHGEIGQGMNDYDAILTELQGANFTGWISIEDGVDGFEQLQRSVAFLRKKMAQYWPGEC
jgi:sugar phosphate isomerase/epimerase